MLVLSRKEDQEILIGDNIKLSVIKIQGNSVRLGIQAPENIRILRGELTEWHEFTLDEAELDKHCTGPPA